MDIPISKLDNYMKQLVYQQKRWELQLLRMHLKNQILIDLTMGY